MKQGERRGTVLQSSSGRALAGLKAMKSEGEEGVLGRDIWMWVTWWGPDCLGDQERSGLRAEDKFYRARGRRS